VLQESVMVVVALVQWLLKLYKTNKICATAFVI
jgi:hypothetical protein